MCCATSRAVQETNSSDNPGTELNMAKVTITTVEEVSVFVYTEFSYDSNEIEFDPTQESGWSLNQEDGVHKVQYVQNGTEITEEQASLVYRLGDSDGAITRRIRVEQGDYKFDSMEAAGVSEVEDLPFVSIDARQLEEAKLAIEGAEARRERRVLGDEVPEGSVGKSGSRSL